MKNNDKLREEFMYSLNLQIVRFTNEEVCKNADLVVKKLKDLIELISMHQNPQP